MWKLQCQLDSDTVYANALEYRVQQKVVGAAHLHQTQTWLREVAAKQLELENGLQLFHAVEYQHITWQFRLIGCVVLAEGADEDETRVIAFVIAYNTQ